jgi:nitroreductase
MTSHQEYDTEPVIVPVRLDTRSPINELLSQRWSPRAFTSRQIEPEDIISLFEAARWSPSSANEQPWRFIVAAREDGTVFSALRDSLMEGNKRWAQHAPLLVLGLAQSTYQQSGKPYRHSLYDLGQSVAHLTVQASSVGLGVHQMGGFDPGKLRTTLSIPEGFEPVIVLAIGYPNQPDSLPDDLRIREQAPRVRKPLENLVFTESWGVPSHHVASKVSHINTVPSTN